MFRSLPLAFLISIILLCNSAALANSGEVLDFGGLGNLQPVGNFYDGGSTGIPNYGVTFSSNVIALRPFSVGGSGNFSPTLLGTPAIFINGTTGLQATGVMNVAPGFSSGLNFYFTAGFTAGQTETVTIWSGANGTGTVLATLSLANNDGSCSSPAYCNWSNVGISFSSTAHSVTFSGPSDQLGLTDITLGSSHTAIPEPSSIYLLGIGLAGVSFGRMRDFLRL